MPTRHRIITAAFVVVYVIALFSIAADADMQEQQRIQAEYCDMVAAGHWPDYKGNAALACPTDSP